MEENTCYVSSGEVSRAEPSTSNASSAAPVYAVVDKKGKVRENPADLYAEVQKKDKKKDKKKGKVITVFDVISAEGA